MKRLLTRGQLIYLVLAAGTLFLYGTAQARGWAGGGTRRQSVPREQLKRSDLGYRNRTFWYYGYRGK